MAASTRDRILSTALAAFARRGVEATSLDQVAEEVGVRKQTILYWFGSKEALVAGVIEAAVSELGQALDTAVARRRPGQAPAVAVVDEVLRLGARRPDLLVLLREVTRLGPPMTSVLLGAVGPWLDLAATALAGPDAPPSAVSGARRRLVEAGARVIATALEAELLEQMGASPDRRWLRRRRADLLAVLGDGARAAVTGR